MIPVQLAEPAVQAALQEWPNSKEMRDFFVFSFCEPFLDQWRYGPRAKEMAVQQSMAHGAVGYDRGMRAMENELKRLQLTPRDFGYTMETLEGTYEANFEISHFIEKKTGKRFHTNLGTLRDLPNGPIKISAWVSPEHPFGFGHMAWCRREIIVLEILK